MLEADLRRLLHTEEETVGALIIGGRVFITLELPYRDNKRNISRIPSGVYDCRLVDSPRFGKVYEVKNVEDRTNILIHAGNTKKDTKGCILLGMSQAKIHGDQWVVSSRAAITELEKVTKGERFILNIWNC